MNRIGSYRSASSSEALSLIVAGIAASFGLLGYKMIIAFTTPVSYSGGVVIGAFLGLVFHEYMHKRAALRRGCSARFVLSQQGMLITFISGLLRSFGFWFAFIAPGYVSLTCLSNIREGPIAAWGPLSNIVLASLASLVKLFVCCWEPYMFLEGFITINAWIAFFNLLPLGPLDGAKIFRENIVLWIAMIVFAGVLVYLG